MTIDEAKKLAEASDQAIRPVVIDGEDYYLIDPDSFKWIDGRTVEVIGTVGEKHVRVRPK